MDVSMYVWVNEKMSNKFVRAVHMAIYQKFI